MIDVTGIKDNPVIDGCIELRTTTTVRPIRHSSVEAARLIQTERRCAEYVQAAVVRQQLQAGRAVSVARRQLRNRVVTMNISPTYATHSVEIIRKQEMLFQRSDLRRSAGCRSSFNQRWSVTCAAFRFRFLMAISRTVDNNLHRNGATIRCISP